MIHTSFFAVLAGMLFGLALSQLTRGGSMNLPVTIALGIVALAVCILLLRRELRKKQGDKEQ